MTDSIMKQRLIGAVLLLLVVAFGATAFLLISNIGYDENKQIDVVKPSGFLSSIELLASSSVELLTETIELVQEALVAPHTLGKQDNKNTADNTKDENKQIDVVKPSGFLSSIELLASSSVELLTETIELDQEALVAPHMLGKQDNKNTADNTKDENKQIDVVKSLGFLSSTELLASSSVELLTETIELDQEALVAPHTLGKQDNKNTADNTKLAILPAPDQVKITSATSTWIIQVGSFIVQKNAEVLYERLSKVGLNSKIEQIKNNYRVRIYPSNNKHNVDETLKKISDKLGIKAAQVFPVTEN